MQSATNTGNSPVSIIPPAPRVLMTVRQLADDIPAVSVGGARWAIFNKDSNGLAESGAILKRGARVLIDRDLYVAWLAGDTQATGPDLAA